MSSASAACRVLSGYRRLIRAQRKLFAEDIYAQSQAKIAIRDYFEQNRSVADTKQLKELMQAIDDAEDMLVHGIAQGKLNEKTGSYGAHENFHSFD